MCQLLCATGREQTDLTDMLRMFARGSRFHKHGWGLADLNPGESRVIKSPDPALTSPLFAKMLTRGFVSKNAFAHLRYATIGDIELSNTHPFAARDNTGREWVLMHQGTVFEFEAADSYFYTQIGTTDSERILLYLLDRVNTGAVKKGGALSANERFSLLDKEIRRMAPGNKLNLAIYDGELIYLHSNYADSLYLQRINRVLLLCSVPLTENGIWQPLPLNTLFALKDGEVVRRGTAHGNTYIDSEEDIKLLYALYANL
ncbi:MAG: class II glutamine amidotransferase [Actinomycetia bacterium]|nr:class II glutamine amidotransferase [Actinomycetes bacterium]